MTKRRYATLTVPQKQAICLAVEGRNWVEIAECLEVDLDTLYGWRQKPLFKAQLTAQEEQTFSETALFHSTYVHNAFGVLHRQAVNKDGKYSDELSHKSAIALIELVHRNIEVIKTVEQNRRNIEEHYDVLRKEVEYYYNHLSMNDDDVHEVEIKEILD